MMAANGKYQVLGASVTPGPIPPAPLPAAQVADSDLLIGVPLIHTALVLSAATPAPIARVAEPPALEWTKPVK